jgi:hypothetical protein
MCEVRAERKWRTGPLTLNMRALLARMAATSSPVIWDFSGIGPARNATLTLDGEPVPGVTLNGLEIRGLVRHESLGGRRMAYRLTEAGRGAQP